MDYLKDGKVIGSELMGQFNDARAEALRRRRETRPLMSSRTGLVTFR
jgi:hypothetical protein